MGASFPRFKHKAYNGVYRTPAHPRGEDVQLLDEDGVTTSMRGHPLIRFVE